MVFHIVGITGHTSKAEPNIVRPDRTNERPSNVHSDPKHHRTSAALLPRVERDAGAYIL